MDESAILFAERLRKARKARHLTQRELAELSGLSTHYIGNLEQAIRRPTLDSLLKISEALDILPTDLIYDMLSEHAKTRLAELDPNLLREEPDVIRHMLSGFFESEPVHTRLGEDDPPAGHPCLNLAALDALLSDSSERET